MNKSKKQRKRRCLAIFSLLTVLSLTFPSSKQARSAAESVLYFSEVGSPGTAVSSKTVSAGDDFTLVATIDPQTNQVNAAELHVSFDPAKFSLTSITTPSAPADCAATPAFSTVLMSPSINNTNGTGSIISGVCMSDPPSPVVTITPMATFVFHAIAATSGSLPIAFENTSQVSAVGEADDVIATMTSVDVTVTSTDSSAPVVSAGLPSGTLPAGTSQTVVSVTTNEAATCRYASTSGVAYSSMTVGSFTTTGGTTHSFTKTGLANGGSYGFYVRCVDVNNNANSTDYLISFSVASPVVITPDPVVPPAPSTTVQKKSSNDDDKKKTKPRSLSNSKKKVKKGDVLIQRGKKFSKNSFVLLYFSKAGGGYYPPTKVKTAANGSFLVKYVVNKPAGKYGWYAVDAKSGKKSKVVYYTVK